MKTLTFALSLLAFVGAGCTGDLADADPSGYDNAALLVVSPSDGATGVSTSGSITLVFAQPPDTSIVGHGFHLVVGSDVVDSCFLIEGGTHGDMNTAMMDPAIMEHLDADHSIEVSMAWDVSKRVATITPHQPLDADEEYMIHFDGRMTGMLETMMSRMIGMEGMDNMANHGFDATPAGIVVHFRTGDQS